MSHLQSRGHRQAIAHDRPAAAADRRWILVVVAVAQLMVVLDSTVKSRNRQRCRSDGAQTWEPPAAETKVTGGVPLPVVPNPAKDQGNGELATYLSSSISRCSSQASSSVAKPHEHKRTMAR